MSEASRKPRRFDRDVDGILLLDKPVGPSSNAALQRARVLYRALKAGHAGSLDPMASGMLPVCFGQATKACAFLLDSRKTYRFTARLGQRSETGDAQGRVIEQRAIPAISSEQIDTVLRASLGEQTQVPPMYSALKHQGQRLYELARKGESVERAPRPIVIEYLQLHSFDGQQMDITVRCSKGTYVRTLAEDLAGRLGTLAHLTALRRLDVDPFAGQPMHGFEELEAAVNEGQVALDQLLLPADQALGHIPAVHFDATGTHSLLHGQAAPGASEQPLVAATWVRMYGPERRFLGLGETDAAGGVQPRRFLVKSGT